MGFLSGRASFVRFRVKGRAPKQFDAEQLARLKSHAIGKQRIAAADGVEAGWVAGDHILDTRFDLEKNIINDTLQCALRIDTQKIPGELLRAYTQVELEGAAASNPSGFASSRQKREAREHARERLEEEAKDGRFLKRKAYPVLWDRLSNEVLVGTTSSSAIDRLHTVFEKSFEHGFELIGAGQRAYLLAELREQTRGIDDAGPEVFATGGAKGELAWLPDESSRDFLGNEFLLWLWYVLETESDTLKLADDSEATVMIARTLTLECPRGQNGKETITSDGPTKLPEARRAIQAGKLPRKAGLTLVRHDKQYEFTLHAESFAVTGAKLPTPDEEDERARLEERINMLRHLIESLDLLYDAFGRVRAGGNWSKESAKIKKWLSREERERVTVATD